MQSRNRIWKMAKKLTGAESKNGRKVNLFGKTPNSEEQRANWLASAACSSSQGMRKRGERSGWASVRLSAALVLKKKNCACQEVNPFYTVECINKPHTAEAQSSRCTKDAE